LGTLGSQTQACGHINQNKLGRSSIRHRRSPQIMFNQLGLKCSSMLLWQRQRTPPPPPTNQKLQEVCKPALLWAKYWRTTHGRRTNKKAASTNVHARTKASLNPPELGTGRLAYAALMLIPRFVYVHQTSQRSQVAMFQPPAIPSRQVSTTAILRITAATALACCLPQTACSACRPPGWDAAAAPAACPPECSTLPQKEAHRI